MAQAETTDRGEGRESGFLTDVETLRRRAREQVERGPVTDAYGADLDRVLDVLQQALATETICTLRYRQHYFAATGMDAGPVAAEFLQHAGEEQGHADQLAARISQLGGTPHLDPTTLVATSHSEYREAEDLEQMIVENLVAERIAIASYTEVIQWLGDHDPTTRRLMEEILAVEEEHAEDLLTFLQPGGAR